MKLGIDALDWADISALLDEALSLPPPERARWLDALPDDKQRHRDTIADLLARSTGGVETGELLKQPRFTFVDRDDEDAAGAAPGPAPGDVVGPYILFSLLGRGGMGGVWLAERGDAQPRRKVALKLPHVGWQPGLAERLARERDILASLEHPNIARLYDAGVDGAGRPWLALEYVDGTPIDGYAEAHALSVRDRLRLLLQVAAAVAHAHTRLVIHRDLKPSNILVTGAGDVRLLDFGIAKLLQDSDHAEATELTRLAGRALTPEYASPEQIRGAPVGTTSDVYSLGVVAYELLTGRRPQRFAPGKAARWADGADDDDPPPASRVAADAATRKALAGDVDAILAKALKKPADERYATVAEFAADIERALDDRPVRARPDRLAYRAWKYARRHAWGLGMAAVLLLTIVAGAGAALWQARSARAEAARAEQVKRFALSMFEEADTDSGAGAKTTAADLLKAAKARIEKESIDRPEVAVELMTSIGYSLLGQDQITDAVDLLRRAVDLGRGELGAEHVLTVAAASTLGEGLVAAGRLDEAAALLEDNVVRATQAKAWHALIEAHKWLAHADLSRERYDAGVAHARAALDLTLEHAGELTALQRAEAWSSYANALNTTRRPGAAGAARTALEMLSAVYGSRPAQPVLLARVLLGSALSREGDLRESIVELSRAVADAQTLLGPMHNQVAVYAQHLGNTQLEAGDVPGAVASLRLSRAATDRGDSGNAVELSRTEMSLAQALVSAGAGAEALSHADRALALLQPTSTAPKALVMEGRLRRATALTALGRLGESDAEFAELRKLGPTGAGKAVGDMELSDLRVSQGGADEAVALARAAAEAMASLPSKRLQASAQCRLGRALRSGGRDREAADAFRAGVALFREHQPVASPERLACEQALAGH